MDIVQEIKDLNEKMVQILNETQDEGKKRLFAQVRLGIALGISEGVKAKSDYDRHILNDIKKMQKEYIDKFYEIAKPRLETFIPNDEKEKYKNKDNLLTLLTNIKIFIEDKLKNAIDVDGVNQTLFGIKANTYYIFKEYEQYFDSKCRAKYYEIIAIQERK